MRVALAVGLVNFGAPIYNLMLRMPGGKSDRRRSCFSLADWLSLRNVRYRKLGSTEFYVAALPEEATAAFARADAAPHLPARHTSRPQSATPLL